MACGTPVITSNTSSLPEVVGDAGIMVDPCDVDGLADVMYEVLTNDGLREDMIRRGLERTKTFSWGKMRERDIKGLRGSLFWTVKNEGWYYFSSNNSKYNWSRKLQL